MPYGAPATPGAKIKADTYTGNATAGRVISTGFKVNWLIITTQTNSDRHVRSRGTGNSSVYDSSTAHGSGSGVTLHASDGFILTATAIGANASGVVYDYAAIG